MTGKEIQFRCQEPEQKAFEMQKKAVITTAILVLVYLTRQVFVKISASNHVLAGVLSQCEEDGKLHSVVFYCWKRTPTEVKYMMNDKQQMTIIWTFEEMRPELNSVETKYTIQVSTDDHNLKYLMSTKNPIHCLSWWLEVLSRFNFQIVNQPAKATAKTQAFDRPTSSK